MTKLLFAAAAALLLAGTASARDVVRVSDAAYKVRFEPAAAVSPEGAERLLRNVETAARRACAELPVYMNRSRCRADAMARVMAESPMAPQLAQAMDARNLRGNDALMFAEGRGRQLG